MSNPKRGRRLCLWAGIAVALLGQAQLSTAGPAGNADLVVLNATLYTADASRHMATAMAVQGERIVYVGDTAGVKAWTGPKTRIINAAGRLVLPGLIDSHIHPTSIVAWDNCDLDDKIMDLQLSEFARRLHQALPHAARAVGLRAAMELCERQPAERQVPDHARRARCGNHATPGTPAR